MAKRIAGIALFPRESRNGVFYHTDELEKFHNVTVPLRFNHDQSEEGIIGTATFIYDPEKQQVKYEATIDKPEFQDLVDNKQFQVSIGVTAEDIPEMCDETERDCLQAPIIGSIDELSIVETPGIPETTLNVLEYASASSPDFSGSGQTVAGTTTFTPTITVPNTRPNHERMKCGGIIKDCNSSIYTSIKVKIKEKSMADKTSEPKKIEEKVKVTIETEDNIEVVNDKDSKKETKEVEPVETPKEEKVEKEDTKKPTVDVSKLTEDVKKEAQKEIKELVKEVREAWVPNSEIKESNGFGKKLEEDYTDAEAKAILEKLDDDGFVKIKIDKEDYIQNHLYNKDKKTGKLTEAVTATGIPIVVTDGQVVVTQGGKTAFSIRQFGKFKAIPVGANTARFYKVNVPNAAAITESPTTDITATTHTLTAINVTTSVRGWRQTVLRSEFEDFPATFLNSIRESARIESIRDEHRLVVQDLASTARDYGGTTTAPYHIKGNDGTAVTTSTLEDAAAEFGENGISFAKRFLQELTDPTLGPNALVAFLSPRAFESLYTSSGLSEYTMIGSASVTRLGQLEKLYGVDIVVTNELLVVANAKRNLVCVKGTAWALASQRGMSIQLQDQIQGLYTNVVWSHRIGVNVLEVNNYVIVSSKND